MNLTRGLETLPVLHIYDLLPVRSEPWPYRLLTATNQQLWRSLLKRLVENVERGHGTIRRAPACCQASRPRAGELLWEQTKMVLAWAIPSLDGRSLGLWQAAATPTCGW